MANGTNIDEKLRAARERREEQLKLLGMRASRGAADQQGWCSTQTHSPFVLSLSGEEQVGAGAAGQAVLWAAAEGAEEETPGAPAQRGEEARCCGGETPAEAEGGESK